MDADVTVIVPTRDRVMLLEQTLATVLAQHPRPVVVVVDDGSSDGTAERLASKPVTVVRNDGAPWGSARARNAGLARVGTPLVAFVDSDDLLLPGALEALADALARDAAAPFAYGVGLSAARTPAGWVPEGLIAPLRGASSDAAALFARNPVPSSGVIARRAALTSVGGFDEGLRFSEDHDLWVRLARLGPPAHAPQLVVVHRRHPGNRHDQGSALEDEAAITRHAEDDPRLGAARADRVGTLWCEHAIEAVRAGRPGELVRASRELWLPGPQRGRILRAAGRHLRRRRAAGEAGQRLWTERGDVRDWLRTAAP